LNAPEEWNKNKRAKEVPGDLRITLSNSSSSWGGVHKVTEVLARELQTRGHDVVVIGYPGRMLEERMRGIAPFEPLLKGPDLGPPAIWRVRRALRRHRADVVLALMTKDIALTGPAAYSAGVPLVFRHANDRPLRRDPYTRLLYGTFAALHVTNAEATRRTLIESAPWLREKIRVIYNGIDAESYENAEGASLDLPRGSLAVGYLGNFVGRKGLLDLTTAWPTVRAAVPNAHLILVGKGSLEEEMRAALGNDASVHWPGYRSDIPEVMRSLDVLVLPSYVEGAPNVVQEAMAAGASIVATAVSGTPELVRDGIEAWLVPPRDPARLSAALIQALTQPADRAKRVRAARQRVREKFGVARMIDSYEEVLSTVASQRRQ
jgi:glycosyltransferase involved in cell wall biosynthesis